MTYRKVVSSFPRFRTRPTLADAVPVPRLWEIFELRDRYDPLLRYAHGGTGKAWLLWHAGYLEAFGQHPPFGAIPGRVIEVLPKALGIALPAMLFPDRKPTFYAHADKVRRVLGYRKFTVTARSAVAESLAQAAARNDDPGHLLRFLDERLKAEKIVRPAASRLERLVESARTSAQQKTIAGVLEALAPEQFQKLDGLREPRVSRKESVLGWLKSPILNSKPPVLLDVLARIAFIRSFELEARAFNRIHADMKRRIARHVQRASLDTLFDDFPVPKRRAYLACYLDERLRALIDAAIEVFDDLVQGIRRRSESEVMSRNRTRARSMNDKLRMFRTIGTVLLDRSVSDAAVRSTIFERVPPDALEHALAETDEMVRPADFNCFDHMRARHSYLRKFLVPFLAGTALDATEEGRPVLDAAAWLVRAGGGRRRSPDGAPLDFVPAAWRPYVCPSDGQLDLRSYDVCLMEALQQGLQSGQIWAVGGRRYGFVEDLLLPRASWSEQADTYHHQLGLPRECDAWLEDQFSRLSSLLAQVNAGFRGDPSLYVEGHRLHIRAPEANEASDRILRLHEFVASTWTDVELPELLLEVNGWLGFVDMFRTLSGHRGRSADFKKALLLTLIMEACNLGMTKVASLAPWANPRLVRRIREQYFYEDSFRTLMDEVVKAFHGLPIAHVLGDESVSMSDGLRVATRVQTVRAAYQPAHLAPGERGLVFYTHVSHQGPAFGAQVIGKERDATYVLDAILHILSELPIREHYTDTHGFTEIVFALSQLFGIDFCPRIKVMHEQQLYRAPGTVVEGPLAGHFKGTIDAELIARHWPDVVRILASIKSGATSAVLLCQRLSSYAQQNPMYQALRELGRLFKTCFILRYYAEPDLRRRIHAGMNRVEHFNALCRHLFYGRLGQNWERELEEQTNRASALAIVASMAALRNAVYMTAAVKRARTEGLDFKAEDLWHVSPYAYEHVIPYGRYVFNLKRRRGRDLFDAAQQRTF